MSVQKDKDRFLIPCDCSCSILEIQTLDMGDEKDDNDFLFLSYYVSAFYRDQVGLFQTLITRMKLLWTIAIGKEYRFQETIIQRKDVDGLIKFLSNWST